MPPWGTLLIPKLDITEDIPQGLHTPSSAFAIAGSAPGEREQRNEAGPDTKP